MKTLRICVFVLKYAGFLPPENIRGWKSFFYYTYSFFSFIILLGVYVTVQVSDLYRVWGDVQAMTADAFLLCTNLAQSFKILNIILKHDRIIKTYKRLNILSQIHNTSDEKNKIVKKYSDSTRKYMYFYFLITYTTIFLWALTPILAAEEGSRPLPFNALSVLLADRYPYDVSLTPAYELTFFQQIAALVITASLNILKDILVCGLMTEIICQFELMKFDLINLNNGPLESGNNDNSERLEKPTEIQKLNKCIEHHQEIFEIIKEVESYFSLPIMFQFTVSLIIICVTAFQLAVTVNTDFEVGQVFGMGFYLFAMMFQVFIYCWHGNNVISQSYSVINAAYECGWYTAKPEFKKTLQILVLRCYKPVRLSAGPFAILSNELFVGIIKSSYSFFTILQQLYT